MPLKVGQGSDLEAAILPINDLNAPGDASDCGRSVAFFSVEVWDHLLRVYVFQQDLESIKNSHQKRSKTGNCVGDLAANL